MIEKISLVFRLCQFILDGCPIYFHISISLFLPNVHPLVASLCASLSRPSDMSNTEPAWYHGGGLSWKKAAQSHLGFGCAS